MPTTKRKPQSPGRPPRLSEASTKQLIIRTTDTERNHIHDRAAKNGMSTAEYIRAKIFA